MAYCAQSRYGRGRKASQNFGLKARRQWIKQCSICSIRSPVRNETDRGGCRRTGVAAESQIGRTPHFGHYGALATTRPASVGEREPTCSRRRQEPSSSRSRTGGAPRQARGEG